MVYIVKRYNQERKERLGDPKYNGDRKENYRIIDSNDRTCQKISDSKDRKDSNIRKGSKNRSGPVMRSHDRSPVIVSFVTGPLPFLLPLVFLKLECPLRVATVHLVEKVVCLQRYVSVSEFLIGLLGFSECGEQQDFGFGFGFY